MIKLFIVIAMLMATGCNWKREVNIALWPLRWFAEDGTGAFDKVMSDVIVVTE